MILFNQINFDQDLLEQKHFQNDTDHSYHPNNEPNMCKQKQYQIPDLNIELFLLSFIKIQFSNLFDYLFSGN